MAAFVGGCVVGWFLAIIVGRSATQAALSTSGGGGASSAIKRVRARVLEVKCQCGAIYKFREGLPAADPSFKPYPKEDCLTCSVCGRSINLLEARKLIEQAEAGIGAP